MPLDITAVIVTYNEEIHLERCIESLKGLVRDIVVVDSYSSDKTQTIASNYNVRFFQNPWVNYSIQFQWALDNTEIKTEWVFRIDADEYIEDDLKYEIRNILPDLTSNITGIYVRRKYVFLGKWIQHGAMYPINVLRLWRKDSGRIEQRWMDEHIILDDGESIQLTGNVVDDNLNTISWWIEKHNGYATREMIDLLNLKYKFISSDYSMENQKSGQAKFKRWLKSSFYAKLPYFVRPVLYFLYRYIFRLGILDGTKGFVFHFMQGCWYRCLVDLKMLEAERWIADERDPSTIKAILSEKTDLML